MLMTMGLSYISSTYESIALNMVPTITFVLALIFHQEKLRFSSINGQAKIWGLVISFGGALALVLWKGPVVVKAMLSISFETTSNGVLGWIMTIVGVLATSFWNILVVSSKSSLSMAIPFLFFFLKCLVKSKICKSNPALILFLFFSKLVIDRQKYPLSF